LKGLIEVMLFEGYRREILICREVVEVNDFGKRRGHSKFWARSISFPRNIKLRPVEKSRFLKMVDFM
jgi:hypothetical protein